MIRTIVIGLALGVVAVGCGDDDDDVSIDAGRADGGAVDAAAADAEMIACDPADEYTGGFPPGADPCADDTRWPLALRSAELPIVVWYSRCEHTAMAAQVRDLVEHAWSVEVGDLGFTAPLPDDGACGDDESFDVFLWPDGVESYVQAIADNPDTPHDDWMTFMVLDPWGPYGGDLLDSTIAHELNHACQAADDWWEHIAVFEMTATFMEEVVYPDEDDWQFVLDDFQANPDWSVDRDDSYETWFMYGSSLLLHFVRERYFAGDASFAAAMWRDSRNPPGDNEPDFEDALDALLQDRAGIGFADAVGEFAAWRWYTGDRADSAHFADGALYPQPAVAATVTTGSANVAIDPMFYGSAYIDVTGTGTVSVRLDAADVSGLRWLVQAIPGAGGATADVLDPTGDTIALDGVDVRTVVVTALPTAGRDPDDQDDSRFAATVVIGE